MSYQSKIEMSYSGSCYTDSFKRRRQDGRKGHYHGEAEGFKAANVGFDEIRNNW